MYIQPLLEGRYFHIYNRGINGEDIFKEERNYHYFLQQYFFYCSDVMETLSYALMRDHFHLLVYIKNSIVIPQTVQNGEIQLKASCQLSHFFDCYTQTVNKAYKRTGALFEPRFERKLIEHKSNLNSMVYYCHHNPQLHHFTDDFRNWKHSSYYSVLLNDNTYLASQKVLDHFGGTDRFEQYHMEKAASLMVNNADEALVEI